MEASCRNLEAMAARQRDLTIPWIVRLFRQGLHDHILQEFFSRQKRKKILEWLGAETAVGPLNTLDSWSSHFIFEDIDVANYRTFECQHLAHVICEVPLVSNYPDAQSVTCRDLGNVRNSEARFRIRAYGSCTEIGNL